MIDGPAWPEVSAAIAGSPGARVLEPMAPDVGKAALAALELSDRSTLGALVLHTAGVLVDDGWVRMHGSGSPALAPLDAWANADPPLDGSLVVAHDVLGGFFALDEGAFEAPDGQVWYLAPDTLEWEPLEVGHPKLFHMLLDPDALARFYEGMRWPGWREEVRALDGRTALALDPPLWSLDEDDPAPRTRRPVPITELWSLHLQGGPGEDEFDEV